MTFKTVSKSTRRGLLVSAYLATKLDDHAAPLSAVGKVLREKARNYDEQFGGKKLSQWIEDHSDEFRIYENNIVYVQYWKEYEQSKHIP